MLRRSERLRLVKMTGERTYSAGMSKIQLKELLRHGTTQLRMGESTYVDVSLAIEDGEDMEEYADILSEQSVSMAYEAALVKEREG